MKDKALTDRAGLKEEGAAAKAALKTRSRMFRGLAGVFGRGNLVDETVLERLEIALLKGDVGLDVATEVLEHVRPWISRGSTSNADAVMSALQQELIRLASPLRGTLQVGGASPFVMLFAGVNGAGKTTTIGKLASMLKLRGHSVLLAAGDTFRAAAIEQLQMWGERIDVPVVAQQPGADGASVIYDSIESARARGVEVVLADTAGRLQANAGLMQELAKVKRVVAKFDSAAPQETVLVLDGCVGQNGISQVEAFSRDLGVTGLIVTKMDGSAKAGVLFSIAKRFEVPVYFVGVGERVEDLQPFDPELFVRALVSP